MTLGPSGEVLSVSVTEPRFTHRERALLLASKRADSAPRGSHGLLLSDATDPRNQFKFKVPPPITDHAQAALSKAQADYEKTHPGALGKLWRVLKDD